MQKTQHKRKSNLNRIKVDHLPIIIRKQDSSPVTVDKSESQAILRSSVETPIGKYKSLVSNRLKSISELINQLDTPTPGFEYITLEDAYTSQCTSNPNRVYRLDVDPNSKFTNYKDIQKLNLQDKQVKLDKMMWDLQDVLDNLVQESSTQMKYLGDIDSMLTHLDDKFTISPSKKQSTPHNKTTEGPEEVYEQLQRTNSIKKNMMDVGVQTVDSVERLEHIKELENRHYRYMMDTLKNLRFKVDILSNLQNADSNASYEQETDSKYYIENTLTIEGSIKEINQHLSSLSFFPKAKRTLDILPNIKGHISSRLNLKKSDSTSKISISDIRRKSVLNSPLLNNLSTLSRRSIIPTLQSSILSKIGQTPRQRNKSMIMNEESGVQSDLSLSINIRLANLDPFMITEIRELPDHFLTQTRRKYEDLEYIQWKMPEIADSRFNIDDIMAKKSNRELISLFTYFHVEMEKMTSEVILDVDREISERLLLYQSIYSKKMALRKIFLSYNIEGVQYVKDILRMGLSGFIKLLKDSMLITKEFDVIEAIKVFYLSCSNNKKLPNRPGEDHRKWLRMLVKSYTFKENYRLSISSFIEALVRITQYHPRFSKLTHLTVHQRLLILYQQNIKPNARMLQGFFYARLLKDTHVRDTLSRFTPKLYELYEAYMTKLPPHKLMFDFKLKHSKLELSQFYTFLRHNDILIDSIFKPHEKDHEEIEELQDPITHKTQQDTTKRSVSQSVLAYQPDIKETVIRFSSSLLNKYENKNVRIHSFLYSFTNHHIHNKLLPFKRPTKNTFRIDKYTAFTFFTTVLAVISIQEYDDIYSFNTKSVTDRDFCIGFSEFVKLMGIMGVYYWKTYIHNENKSLIEALVIFFQEYTSHSNVQPASGAFDSSKSSEKEILTSTVLNFDKNIGRQLLTQSGIPQERFLSRRYSI